MTRHTGAGIGAAPFKFRHFVFAAVLASFVGALALDLGGQDHLLVVYAVTMVAAGFGLAALCWLRGVKREEPGITAWDLAGASAMVGFAAAALVE